MIWIKRRSPRRRGRVFLPESLEPRQLLTLSVAIDYSQDNGFFTPDVKQLLQSTLDAIVIRFGDALAAQPKASYDLDYGTTGTVRHITTTVPANTLKVYAYGAPLDADKLAQGGSYSPKNGAAGRGQAAGDYTPQVSFLMFDTDGTSQWYFGSSTSGLTTSKTDFVTVARHEFMHALGLTTNSIFNGFRSGDTFTGTSAKNANGGNPVPLQPGGAHIGDSLTSVFNSSTPRGVRRDLGAVEYGMLKDMGWNVSSTTNPTPTTGSFSRHTLLTGGQEGDATLTVFPTRGVYLSQVDVLRGDHLVITTQDGSATSQKGVDTYLRLFDASGTLVASDDDGGGGNKSKIDKTFTVGGTYYVGSSTYAARNYSLTSPPSTNPSSSNQFLVTARIIRPTPAQPDRAYEVTAFLNPTAAGVAVTSAVSDDYPGRFVGINVQAGSIYRVTTSLPLEGGLVGKAIPTVYDTNGRKVAGVAAGNSYGGVQFTARSTGRYFIAVSASAGGDTTPISSEGDFEVGGSWGVAGSEYSASGTYSSGADYRLVITKGGSKTPADYDGDGITDLAIYIPDIGSFALHRSTGGPDVVTPFGPNGNRSIAAPGDYDGDGKADLAVYIPDSGLFAYRPSSGGPDVVKPFGPAGRSVAAPGDYDGDGKTDLAVFIPDIAYFAYRPSAGGSDVVTQFGPSGYRSIATPGDYDGDGKTDIAVFVPDVAVYAIHPSTGGADRVSQFGPANYRSVPAPGDYDGDGKTDLGVFVSDVSHFAYRGSAGGADLILPFGPGNGRSVAVAGDYDGDGRTDLSVYIADIAYFAFHPTTGGDDSLTQFGPPNKRSKAVLQSIVTL